MLFTGDKSRKLEKIAINKKANFILLKELPLAQGIKFGD